MCPRSSTDQDLYDNELTDLGAKSLEVVTNTKFNGVALIDVAGTAAASNTTGHQAEVIPWILPIPTSSQGQIWLSL